MTNQKAAEMIRNDMKLHHDSLSGEYRKALNMAISALQEQDVSDTNFGDMISRQVAIDALMAEPLKWDDSSVWESARCYQWMMDMDAIKALPSTNDCNF